MPALKVRLNAQERMAWLRAYHSDKIDIVFLMAKELDWTISDATEALCGLIAAVEARNMRRSRMEADAVRNGLGL